MAQMCLQNAPKSKKRNQSIFRAFLLTDLLKGIKLRKELKDFIEASNIHGKLQIFFASKFSKNNDFRNKIFDFFLQIFGPDEVTDTKTNFLCPIIQFRSCDTSINTLSLTL